jgi:hypothetical protein
LAELFHQNRAGGRRDAATLVAGLIFSTQRRKWAVKRMREKRGALARISMTGNVGDLQTVFRPMGEMKPDIVFHAAALKHVPPIESQDCEGVLTNAVGTGHVVDAAVECGRSAVGFHWNRSSSFRLPARSGMQTISCVLGCCDKPGRWPDLARSAHRFVGLCAR